MLPKFNFNEKQKIIIIDFGSQVTKLIARRIRELKVYCEIINLKEFHKINSFGNKGYYFIWRAINSN